MKPYLRNKKIKGFVGKKNYHIHINNKKIGNWWEDFNTFESRRSHKQKISIN